MVNNCVFGTYRAVATKISSISITSVNPATIRICDFGCKGHREFVSYSEFPADAPGRYLPLSPSLGRKTQDAEVNTSVELLEVL
jgi:hypothetical protein